jgi:shikimate dehydrogenase
MKKEPAIHIGIIGHPLTHTLSPALHNAAAKELHLPLVYGTLDVSNDFLPALITSLRSRKFRGANVTIPYKETVVPLLDEIKEEAASVGAVNTIVNEDGKLIGYNTDVTGIARALESVRDSLKKKSILILGAGGAARAAAYAVANHCLPDGITIFNRTKSRAENLVGHFQKLFPKIVWKCFSERERLPHEAEASTLIINATSVGMSPRSNVSPLPPETGFSNHQIIFDIIYTPLRTALLKQAETCGAATINGVEMFIHQGARAFELWTGKPLPLALARETVLKKLKENHKRE